MLDDATPPEDPRIPAALDNWKRKLLDLGKRNRALNFKVNRVSTVTMVDERPAEVFRRLYLLEKGMRFKPAPEAPARPQTAPEALLPEELREEEEETGPSFDFVPYETADLADRHKDDLLQTTALPEQLDKSLRRIDEQARATLEEQGVNALFLALGMLHYTESREGRPEESFRAPLVLLPVALQRRSAGTGYTLNAADEDPIVNPALAESLRRAHGLQLPGLPDPAEIAPDYDLQTFFRAAADVIAGRPGWSIKSDIFLGLFSFQKFVMYKDLEANGGPLSRHPLLRRLVTRTGESFVGLPGEVRALDLDREYPPEARFQVVDADSSQLRAIAAVDRGYDLVLEGPPGTGKSQTITNLISQALGSGRSVLFVAEKMAALQVVHSRLVNAGLGEFCLELHSTKANKRAVLKEIAAALDASLQRSPASGSSGGRLQEVRAELDAYVRAVHTPRGTLAITPYQAYGRLGEVLDAPKLPYSGRAEEVTAEQLDEAGRDLERLAEAARPIGNPAVHPWRETARQFYPEEVTDRVEVLLAGLLPRLETAIRLASEAEVSFGLPPIRTFAEIETVAEIAGVLGRSPGAPLGVLESDAWNAPPAAALDLVETGRRLNRLRERAGQRFAPEALERDHAGDIAYVETKEQSLLRFLSFLDGRYKAIRQRWTSWRLPGYQPTMIQQADDIKDVDALRRERQALASRDAEARQLFGGLWQGESSSWDALESYIRWVVEFRGLCVARGLRKQAAAVAASPRPDLSRVTELRETAAAIQPLLADLRLQVQWPADALAAAPLPEIRDRLQALRDNAHLAYRWAAFEQARAKAATGAAGEILTPAMTGEVPFVDLPGAFRRAFYQRWLNGAVEERQALRAFDTLTHEQRVAEFRRLDRKVLEENRARLVARLREKAQTGLQTREAQAAMPFLRREMARQRGHSPLRRTLQNAGAAIRAIKPCFLMSPLTVAQLVDGQAPTFDLVVFDEASQLPAEDAVGAIARGQRLVVVGDPKQLPPTNFFAVMGGQVAAPLGEDGTPLYEDSESILEEYMAAGVPLTRLRWHYRSTHESLITFSNVSFYDAGLHTFPSVETDSHAEGLQFEHVADGVYEGKGVNLVEARRVVDAVVRHARETPSLSLGVGTFSLRQQQAIQDELENRRRQDPSLEPFFAPREEGAFFVKNLENIQGDERDVIFLSVTYGRDAEGKLRHNFGPINGENGWRRLNVLTTRARHRMRVFSSMRGDDIQAARTGSRGALLLREFLLYAERGRLESGIDSAAAPEETALERDVYRELTGRGLQLQPRVGVAGYRIDFGVLDDAAPGRYLCGLECDGPFYQAAETTRDRDRLRQEVLEARGWTLLRVWSTDWFKDRRGQIERLLQAIEELRRKAREEAAAEAEAQVREGEERAREAAARPAPPEVSDPEPFADGENLPPPPDLAPASSLATAVPYQLTPGENRHARTDILTVPMARLIEAVGEVVRHEAPLHVQDLETRVAGQWGTRLGKRVQERIAEASRAAGGKGVLERRGDFVWPSGGDFQVRSRAGMPIPAERIPPEEYRAAVLLLLRSGATLERRELMNEARALLGFHRTGAKLQEALGIAIDALLAEGVIGHGSAGFRLRE